MLWCYTPFCSKAATVQLLIHRSCNPVRNPLVRVGGFMQGARNLSGPSFVHGTKFACSNPILSSIWWDEYKSSGAWRSTHIHSWSAWEAYWNWGAFHPHNWFYTFLHNAQIQFIQLTQFACILVHTKLRQANFHSHLYPPEDVPPWITSAIW